MEGKAHSEGDRSAGSHLNHKIYYMHSSRFLFFLSTKLPILISGGRGSRVVRRSGQLRRLGEVSGRRANMLSGALLQLLRDPVVPYPRGVVFLATPSEPQRSFTSKKSLLCFTQVGFDVWLFLVCPAGVFREAQCRGARASPSPYVISYPHYLPPEII